MAEEIPLDNQTNDAVPGVAQELPRPITCIINTHSRRGRERFNDAVAALESSGIPIVKAHAVQDTAETEAILRQQVAEGAHLVIVGGGDGTLSQCAGVLAGTEVAMGVLPLGTGNTLARSLGIPIELNAAARALADGHIIRMDVGRVNGEAFLNSVTLGLSTEIAHALTPKVKKLLGIFSWPVIGFKVFARHRALVLRVQSAERSYKVRTHQLVVANGHYIAWPLASSPEAAVDDHTLDVFVLGREDKKSLIYMTLQLLRGRHTKLNESKFFQTRSVRIESMRRPVATDVDGEISQRTPLDITIEPGALRVVVPRGYDAQNI